MGSVQIEEDSILDKSVRDLTNHLYRQGVLDQFGSFKEKEFYQLHEILTKSFNIPETSITKIMSRLMFSIGKSKKPKVLVGAGTYAGNALAWLSGYYLLDKHQDVEIYGLDISSKATNIAKKNFDSIQAKNVNLVEADAIEWLKSAKNDSIDLLYIDIDTVEDGKKKYFDLLKVAYSKLTDGGIILAHDINEEKFKEDLKPFINEVQDRSKYSKSFNLNVDSFGLSVTVKGASNGDL